MTSSLGLSAHHVGITVTDLESSLELYHDVLGLEVIDRFHVSGEAFETAVDVAGASAHFAHLDAGDVRLELVEYDPSEPSTPPDELNQAGAVHVGLTVENLEETYASLPATVETLSAPQTTESGTTISAIQPEPSSSYSSGNRPRRRRSRPGRFSRSAPIHSQLVLIVIKDDSEMQQ